MDLYLYDHFYNLLVDDNQGHFSELITGSTFNETILKVEYFHYDYYSAVNLSANLSEWLVGSLIGWLVWGRD